MTTLLSSVLVGLIAGLVAVGADGRCLRSRGSVPASADSLDVVAGNRRPGGWRRRILPASRPGSWLREHCRSFEGRLCAVAHRKFDCHQGPDLGDEPWLRHLRRRAGAVIDHRWRPWGRRAHAGLTGWRPIVVATGEHGCRDGGHYALALDRRAVCAGTDVRRAHAPSALDCLHFRSRANRAGDEAIDSDGESCPPRLPRQPRICRRSIGITERWGHYVDEPRHCSREAVRQESRRGLLSGQE